MIDWERLFLITLSTSLAMVLVMTWIGRYNQPADTEQGFDQWFFEGLRVVFAVFEGDSKAFREHAAFCPVLAAALSVSVPLSAVGTVLALLWSYLPHHVPCFNKVWYIFSELEPNSIRMANSIQKNMDGNTGVFIFLRTHRDKLNPEIQTQLKKLNHHLYHKDETAFLRWRWRRRRILRFFFLSENTDENFSRMREFLENARAKTLFTPTPTELPDGQFQHELYLLSETESAPMLIDHLREILQESKNSHIFRNTELRLLDRFRAVSYDLLLKEPLHKHIDKGTGTLHVLVLGFGRIGREFFRAACSMGVLHNCTTEFTICDQQAHEKRERFLSQCPELPKSVTIHSEQLDADSSALDKLLAFGEFHYIIVALGDDERNIRVASRLKRYYRRRHWECLARQEGAADIQPQICVNIEDSVKHTYTKELWLQTFKGDRPLHIFGGLDQAFSKEVLMPERLWNAARWIHLQINNLTNDRPLTWNEYERRSSIACAAHAEYHVAAVCAADEGKSYDNLLKDLSDAERDALIDTEHRRWMAYVRSEGLTQVSTNLVDTYYCEIGDKHVDILGKLTPCLVDSREELSAVWNHLKKNHPDNYQKKRSFQERDEFLVCSADVVKQGIKTGIFPNPRHNQTA